MSKKKLSFEKNRFGITDFDFWFHNRPIKEIKSIIEAAASLMADVGIHWDRVHLPGFFSWNVTEHTKGKYDWTIVDALVKIAQEYMINLTPNIWPYAAWDQEAYSHNSQREAVELGLGCGAAVPIDSSFPIPKRYGIPHDLEAYGSWLAALVERYNGNGVNDMPGLKYPIKYWEIAGGYRAIVPFFFVGTPEEFVRLLRKSYVTIKDVDPDSKVINAGPASLAKILANPEMDLSTDPELVFFEETLKLGCGDFFDVLSIMMDGLDKNPSLKLINYYKDLLEKYGYKKPLWINELAPHCDQGNFMGYDLPYRSLEEQAANQVKHFVTAFSAGVDKAYYTALGSAIPEDLALSQPLESVGYIDLVSLLNAEGKARPAYYTYKLMVSVLDNFEMVKPLKTEKGVEAYRFDSNNNSIYVLWSNSKRKITLDGFKSRYVTRIDSVPVTEKGKVLLDKDGSAIFQEKSLETNRGQLSLELDERPVFLRIEN